MRVISCIMKVLGRKFCLVILVNILVFYRKYRDHLLPHPTVLTCMICFTSFDATRHLWWEEIIHTGINRNPFPGIGKETGGETKQLFPSRVQIRSNSHNGQQYVRNKYSRQHRN